jgi:FkbM family methyltransferase
MTFTSYAQNFEDVMLWRALSHVEHGFYVDIGAQDPIVDSVSLAFHERGWRGVHVEPVPKYAELLRQQRPGDTVIQAAVGNGPGILQFFEIPGSGISTADANIAAQHRERGYEIHETTVPCVTLSSIFDASAASETHWLKIDVEGFERQVLTSWSSSAARPWIVVVESTLPMTQIETHQNWEPILIGYGYSPIYFDGLNRYYLSHVHPELKAAFLTPPNIFDGFALNGTANAPFHALIEGRCQQRVNENLAQGKLRSEKERALQLHHAEQIDQGKLEIESLLRTLALREKEFAAQALATQQQSAEKVAAEAHRHAEQERALHREYAGLGQVFGQQLKDANERASNEIHQHLKEFIERERALQGELGSLRDEHECVKTAAVQRERELTQEAQKRYESARGESVALLQQLAERERTFTSRLEQLQSQMQQTQAEATRAHTEREKEIISALRTESELSVKLQQQIAEHKAEIQATRGQEEMLRDNLLLESGRAALMAADIAEMQRTLSWRLTVPLRRASQLLLQRRNQLTIEHQTDTTQMTHGIEKNALARGQQASSSTMVASHNVVVTEPRLKTTESSRLISRSTAENFNIQGRHLMPEVQHVDQLLDLDDTEFVESTYQILLGRAPDPDGLHYYLGRLRTGNAKARIVGEIADSAEARSFGTSLTGLDELLATQEKATHWFWGAISRGRRIERQLCRLENELGLIGKKLAILQKESNKRSVFEVSSENAPKAPLGHQDASPGFRRAIPNEKDIYWQIKHSISMKSPIEKGK